MLGVNLLFLLLTIGAAPASGVMITAVTFSGLTLAYLIVANMFVSFAGIHEVFSAPGGYNTLLAPVPGWKIIISRVVPAAVMDIVMMAIGIFFVVWNSLRLSGMLDFTREYLYLSLAHDISFAVVVAAVGYALLLMMYCFFRVISKSCLHGTRLPNLLGVVLTFAAIWVVTSLTNLLLLPFGRVEIFGPLVNITLYPSPMARFMYILVLLLQAAVFFLASARLMERRLNV